MGPLLRTAPEVWEHFVARGGLQPDAWDAPLVNELGAALGLGDGDVAAELAARGITAERLIHALLGTLAPFSAMMGELLALFEEHGIKRSDGSAEIVFDFDGEDRPELRFNLEAFRRARQVWERALVPSIDADWLRDNAWPLRRMLADELEYHDWWQLRPSTEGWIEDYRAGGWPELPLVIPPSGIPALDIELARVGGIWAAVLNAIRRRAPDRKALRAGFGSDDPLMLVLAWIEGDYFLLQLASAVLAVATPEERSGDPEALAVALRTFLDDRPFTGEPVEQLLE